MVAVCIVANTLFPVVDSIARGEPAGHPAVTVSVRQEDGTLTQIPLSAERSLSLLAHCGEDLESLIGRPWRSVLADLPS